MAGLGDDAKALAVRVTTSVSAVAGVASLFYGLDNRHEAYQWIWALVGVALMVGALPPIFKALVRVYERYTDYPRVLGLLAGAQQELTGAKDQASQLENALPKAFHAGLVEGVAQTRGLVMASLGGNLTGSHVDLLDGEMVIYADAVGDGTEPVDVGARYVLATGAGRGVAVLAAESEGPLVLLRRTGWHDPDSWQRLSDSAVSGGALPPGLEFHPCRLDDYDQFDEPTVVDATAEESK